jgi:hypothetical protein
MKPARYVFTAMILAALFLSAGAPALALDAAQNHLKRAKLLSETAERENLTDTWMEAFDTYVRLNGEVNQCLEIRFSTEASVSGSTERPSMLFRALVDGTEINPGPVFFEASSFSFYNNFSFSWWECGLTSMGDRVRIRVEYMTGNPANWTAVRRRTLILERRK